MNRLQELMQILQGRVECTNRAPDELLARSDEEWAQGVLYRGKVWRSLGGGHGELYYACAPGSLTETELQLLRLLLTQGAADYFAKRALWEEKIEQALSEPLQAFAGPVRIEDELESIAVPLDVACLSRRAAPE